MAWEVEFTNEFGAWWNNLTAEEQEDISAVVNVLDEKGPSLRRPYVGTIADSRHPNMKELVIQRVGRPYRVLFAFDPHRAAILLIGEINQAILTGMRSLYQSQTIFTTSISSN
jgi:hypothetical protein